MKLLRAAARVIIISFWLLSGCSPLPQKKVCFKMNTIVEITIFQEKDAAKTKKVFAEVEDFMSEWDERFSPTKNTSEILRINSRESDTVEISDDLYAMIDTALFFSKKLDGAFDITIKPLKDFWNVASIDDEHLPDPNDSFILDTLSKILENVDYRKISLITNPKRVVFENREIKIDLGGMAKSFAIEKMREILLDNDISNFIINVGGDVFVSGKKTPKNAILVGIKNPRKDEILQIVSTDNGAIVSSGDYERFRIADSGARVHHIFDTKSGFPASGNIAISIIGESIITADILATGLFSFNEAEIRERIKDFAGYEFLLVDSVRNVFSSQYFFEKDI